VGGKRPGCRGDGPPLATWITGKQGQIRGNNVQAATMRKIRLFHQYMGLFFAPMILLFALSGALQTFRLQEAHEPNAPAPPGWIVWLASVHKDQSLPRAEPERDHAPAPREAPKPRPLRPSATPRPSPLPLKIFVTILSIGLIISTVLGIAIALNNRTIRRLSVILLASGTILPLLLLLV
jgi:hypothetical protein